MARNYFAACLIAALALGACGKDKSAADATASKQLAAARGRGDSTRKVREAQAAADSVARVRYTACSDSMTTVMAKAPSRARARVTPAASAAMIEG
ncbi:MAG: hypothetical protein H0U85_02675, partial [Gemmatimonadales bacterium]|nr:hypothetical protein [Gemmatimonadales bacterium]